MIKKMLFIVILLFPISAFSDIGVGILSEQIGVSHELSLKMNNGHYHKIFSLGKGPFNPAPGLWIDYSLKKYLGELSLSYSQQSIDGYFGEKLTLAMFNIDLYGGYIYNINDYFTVTPKVGVGISDYSLYFNSYGLEDTRFNIRALLELGYSYFNDKVDGKLFFSFSLGVQNPIRYNLDEAGFVDGEPYMFNFKVGVLSK